MSVSEAGAGATGDTKTNNAEETAVEEDLVKLIANLKEPGVPVQERCTNFRRICNLLDVDINLPMRQAVEAGLIPVLNLLLSKTPSDWIFEMLRGLTTPSSNGDAGSSNKLITASIWLPPLLEFITQTQIRAAWAASKVVEDGFRDEALNQGLLETLTKMQRKGRSRKLWNYTMGAVADFFLQDLPMLEFEAARPAIRFLARSLKSRNMDLRQDSDVFVGGYEAIWALTEMAEQGGPEYIQEMMNAGLVVTFMGLMRDLMQESDEESPVWIKLTACIAFLVMRNHRDEHRQAFIDAGIVEVSMGILRDSILGNDTGSWKNVTSWIAHLMMETGVHEHRLAFIDAGVVDFLPHLLQHDLDGVRLNGCLIALALARSADNTYNTLLFETGCVRWIFKSASAYHSDEESDLRPCAIDVLAFLCIASSDDLVKRLILKGYHRPVTDALDGDLFDNETLDVQELWTEATARVDSLIAQSKWLRVRRKITECLWWLNCGNSS